GARGTTQRHRRSASTFRGSNGAGDADANRSEFVAPALPVIILGIRGLHLKVIGSAGGQARDDYLVACNHGWINRGGGSIGNGGPIIHNRVGSNIVRPD